MNKLGKEFASEGVEATDIARTRFSFVASHKAAFDCCW